MLVKNTFTKESLPGVMALIQDNILLHQDKLNSGYASDNEASDNEDPQDSGRTTRSSAKRNNQQSNQDTDSSSQSKSLSSAEKASGDSGKGRKRKKNITNSGDGSDSDSDRGGDKNRLKLDGTAKNESDNQSELVVCSCPKNVMKCIGILPSLPIISYFHDSDESDSSFDDLSHVVLPIVNRNPRGQKEDC